MSQQLHAKKVAILVADGFEEVELTAPQQALEAAGAQTQIVSPVPDHVTSWQHGTWGQHFAVDVPLTEANPNDFDALLLPGGTINPDRLRRDPHAVQFVRAFFESGKPIGAICHGPWLLVEADVVRGRTVTSFHSIKTDVKNAGAQWVDQEVVTDHGLVTSRKPDDIPAFNRELVAALGEQ